MLTLILITIVMMILFLHVRKQNQFPGPPRLPLFGSVPWLKLARGMNDWMLCPIVTKHKVAFVKIGSLDVYVINDFQLAKELFSSDVFSYREPSHFVRNHRWLKTDEPVGIFFTNGEKWSTQRRFGLRTLRDFGFGKKKLEKTINFEIDEVIDQFTKEAGHDVKIGNNFSLPIINILWQLVAGYRFQSDDEEGRKMVDWVQRIFKQSPTILQVLPFFLIKLFPSFGGYNERAYITETQREFMLRMIEEHKKTFDPEDLRDFIDVYLLQIRNDKKFTVGDLCNIMLDFFQAGTDTSSTNLKWTLLLLTTNQDCQEKCRQEIKTALGDRRPEVADMAQLPYTMATVTEIQRIACVAPRSLDHNTTQEYTSGEYTFPKGAVCWVNISFIMKDPAHFKDPHTFNPDRFLDPEGQFVRNERIIPFGIGKRFCMGDRLAKNTVFLFTVSMLQRLQFLPPEHHAKPDPEDFLAGMSMIPNDFYIKFKPIF